MKSRWERDPWTLKCRQASARICCISAEVFRALIVGGPSGCGIHCEDAERTSSGACHHQNRRGPGGPGWCQREYPVSLSAARPDKNSLTINQTNAFSLPIEDT